MIPSAMILRQAILRSIIISYQMMMHHMLVWQKSIVINSSILVS